MKRVKTKRDVAESNELTILYGDQGCIWATDDSRVENTEMALLLTVNLDVAAATRP